MGVTLERVQSKFACIIGELCNEPDILSQFAIWVDIRLAEYKTKGSISLDCSGCEPDPKWLRGHKGRQLGGNQGEVTEREPWSTGSAGVNPEGLTSYIDDHVVEDDKEAEQFNYNDSANSLGEDIMSEDVRADRLTDIHSRDVDNYQESDSVQSWRDEGLGEKNLTVETQGDKQDEIQSDVQLMKDDIDPRAELGEEEVVFPTHIYKIMPHKRTSSCRLIRPKSENHNLVHTTNSGMRNDQNSMNFNFQQGRLSTPKVCDQCGQVYYRYDSFRRHRRTHLAEKKHECVLCPKQFSRNEHLKRHMMSRHPDFFNMGTPLPDESSDQQMSWND